MSFVNSGFALLYIYLIFSFSIWLWEFWLLAWILGCEKKQQFLAWILSSGSTFLRKNGGPRLKLGGLIIPAERFHIINGPHTTTGGCPPIDAVQSSPVGRGRGELGDKNNQIADEEDEDVVHDDRHTTKDKVPKLSKVRYPLSTSNPSNEWIPPLLGVSFEYSHVL